MSETTKPQLTPPQERWSLGLRRAQERAAHGRARLDQHERDDRRERLVVGWLRSLERR